MRHRRYFPLFVLAAAVLMLATSAGSASALDLYKIHGTVNDPLGRVLAAVTVEDGNGRTGTTNASGAYTIPQQNTGTFAMRASRAGLAAATQSIYIPLPLDRQVNWTLQYELEVDIDLQYRSTAEGPNTVEVEVTSWAPNPGTAGDPAPASCIELTDLRTGTAPAVSLGATNADGSHTYTASIALPEQTKEGNYSVSAQATTCDGNVDLSPLRSHEYTVDNTAPALNQGMWPLRALGNTLDFPADKPQPLSMWMSDELSGVDAGTIEFSLAEDVTGATPVALSATTYDPASGVARTASPVNSYLVKGKKYLGSVEAKDRAGNVATYSQAAGTGTLVTDYVDLLDSNADASIQEVGCGFTGARDLLGNQEIRCEKVPVHVEATDVTLSGTGHAGIGTIEHEIDLAAVDVTYSLQGVPLTVGAGMTGLRHLRAPFAVPASSASPATYFVPQVSASLAELRAYVPPGAASPKISMPLTPTKISSGPVCPDPTAAGNCSPDPIQSESADAPMHLSPMASHTAPCDAVLDHAMPVAVPASADIAINVQVDLTQFTPYDLAIVYGVDGGSSTRSNVYTLAGSTATFTIPNSAAAEGNRLVYHIEGSGIFPAGPCAGSTFIAAPTNLRFVTLVTDSLASSNDDLRAASAAAMVVAANQPEYLDPEEDQPSQEDLCDSFSAPTPCELFPQSTVSRSEQAPEPEANAMSAATAGCSEWNFRVGDKFFVGQNVSYATEEGLGSTTENYWTSSPSESTVGLLLSADQRNYSGVARAWRNVSAGYSFHLSGGDSSARYDVSIEWTARGRLAAGANATKAKMIGFFIPVPSETDAEGYAEGYLVPGFQVADGNRWHALWARQDLPRARAGTEFGSWGVLKPLNQSGTFSYDRDSMPDYESRHWFVEMHGKARAETELVSGNLEATAFGEVQVMHSENAWELQITRLRFRATNSSLYCDPDVT